MIYSKKHKVGGLEYRNFLEVCSDNFYEMWQRLQLIDSTVLVWFRKDQQGSFFRPRMGLIKK